MKVKLSPETAAHYNAIKATRTMENIIADNVFDIVTVIKTKKVPKMEYDETSGLFKRVKGEFETVEIETTVPLNKYKFDKVKRAAHKQRQTCEYYGVERQRGMRKGFLSQGIPDSIREGITTAKPGKSRIEDLAAFYTKNAENEISPFTVSDEDIAEYITGLDRENVKVYTVSREHSTNLAE